MKIEKLNENQIKCTLTRQDLEERKIRLSELVYGSDKAKQLFKDMLQIASVECGFDGEEMPIMVEAIPASSDALVLIITKVENPEELDTRFSQFTPGVPEENEGEPDELFSGVTLQEERAAEDEAFSDIEDVVRKTIDKMKEVAIEKLKTAENGNNGKKVKVAAENQYRVFRFENMDQISRFSKAAYTQYKGLSNLYKDVVGGKYYLVVFLKNISAANFNQVCNIASEYGTIIMNISLAFVNEHYKLIAKDDAVERTAVML